MRFYYHHWMLMAVPLLMALLGLHKPSYKNILWAPTGLLMLMLFIILNQIFQSELGFIPLRSNDFWDINYKNSSYIWGPGNHPIGELLANFTPEFFTRVPIGPHAGQIKYWPWFWMICPVYVLATPLAFLIAVIFDRKAMAEDYHRIRGTVRHRLKHAHSVYYRTRPPEPGLFREQSRLRGMLHLCKGESHEHTVRRAPVPRLWRPRHL